MTSSHTLDPSHKSVRCHGQPPLRTFLPPPTPLHRQGCRSAATPYKLCFCINETERGSLCCSLGEHQYRSKPLSLSCHFRNSAQRLSVRGGNEAHVDHTYTEQQDGDQGKCLVVAVQAWLRLRGSRPLIFSSRRSHFVPSFRRRLLNARFLAAVLPHRADRGVQRGGDARRGHQHKTVASVGDARDRLSRAGCAWCTAISAWSS